MQKNNYQKQRTARKERQEKNRKIEKIFKPTKIIKKAVPKKPVISKKQSILLNSIYSWETKEFEKIKRSSMWYLYFYLILFAIATISLLTNNLLLSILTILFGLIFYLFEKREPENCTFGITKEGIFAQDNFYSFSSIENFWIFYEPNGIKELSLKNKKNFIPYTQVPIGNADPAKVREILLNFIPEEEREHNIIDLLERYF